MSNTENCPRLSSNIFNWARGPLLLAEANLQDVGWTWDTAPEMFTIVSSKTGVVRLFGRQVKYVPDVGPCEVKYISVKLVPDPMCPTVYKPPMIYVPDAPEIRVIFYDLEIG